MENVRAGSEKPAAQTYGRDDHLILISRELAHQLKGQIC